MQFSMWHAPRVPLSILLILVLPLVVGVLLPPPSFFLTSVLFFKICSQEVLSDYIHKQVTLYYFVPVSSPFLVD